MLISTVEIKNEVRAVDWAINGKYIAIGDSEGNIYTLLPDDLSVITQK